MTRNESVLKITIPSMILLGIAVQVHAQKPPADYKDMANLAIRPQSEWIQELQNFESSNLPIFVIDTDGAEIPDEPKIQARMGIVYNGPGNRNYASRTVHVELILDGVYQGIYILTEKVKPDPNRVNITKMDPEDITGDEVTGGYIYEIAKGWVPIDESLSRTEGDNRRIKYPNPDKITDEQRAYIAKYDDDFRTLMEQPGYADPVNGYAAWIDVKSFIDEILLQDITSKCGMGKTAPAMR